MTYEDFPFEEVAKTAERLVNEGNLVFQKWTCRFCGERITMEHPNTFTTKGMHQDCSIDPVGLTDIKAQGCNYMMIQANSLKGRNAINDMMMREDEK